MVSSVSLIFVAVLALLPLLTQAFTYRVKTCSAYKASKSNNALTKYCSCTVKLCPNQYASIDSCGKCSGTQYLRLYAANNTQVAQSNGLSSTCSPCSRISNFRPRTTKCQTYKLREGCAGTGQCSATVKIFVANTTIPSNYTSVTVQSVSHRLPFGSFQSLLSGDVYEEEEVVDEEDHADDWQVEVVPDIDESDPHALETAIRYHHLNKAQSVAKPVSDEVEEEEDLDEDAYGETEAHSDEEHRRLLGSPTRSPSRSPTRRPTSASVASGYCMTKKKASKMAVIVGVIIPVVFVLFAVGIAVLRRYQRNKNVSVSPGVQMMPQNGGYGGQPQPMMMGQPQQPMMMGQPQPMMMGQPQQPMMMGQPQPAYGQPQPMMMGQPQSAYGQPQPMMMGQPQPAYGQPQPMMMMGQPQPGAYGQPQPMMMGQSQPMVMAQPVGYAPVQTF